jgi:hypothetical protein
MKNNADSFKLSGNVHKQKATEKKQQTTKTYAGVVIANLPMQNHSEKQNEHLLQHRMPTVEAPYSK